MNAHTDADQLAFIRNDYVAEFLTKEILPKVAAVPKAGNAIAIVADFFVRKATESLNAICVLCQNSFGEDALVLGRTIL
jgi:hypothetical protein